jgi:hypothetical protein
LRAEFLEAMYVGIVAEARERRYWKTWARDVASIAGAQLARIRACSPTRMPVYLITDFIPVTGYADDAITALAEPAQNYRRFPAGIACVAGVVKRSPACRVLTAHAGMNDCARIVYPLHKVRGEYSSVE